MGILMCMSDCACVCDVSAMCVCVHVHSCITVIIETLKGRGGYRLLKDGFTGGCELGTGSSLAGSSHNRMLPGSSTMKREEKSFHVSTSPLLAEAESSGGMSDCPPTYVTPCHGESHHQMLAHGTPPPLPRASHHSGKFLFYDIKSP